MPDEVPDHPPKAPRHEETAAEVPAGADAAAAPEERAVEIAELERQMQYAAVRIQALQRGRAGRTAVSRIKATKFRWSRALGASVAAATCAVHGTGILGATHLMALIETKVAGASCAGALTASARASRSGRKRHAGDPGG